MVSRSQKGFRGVSGLVKAAAIAEANEFCERENRAMKLIKTTREDMKPFQSDASAEVLFKCLEPGDPELNDPTFEEVTD